MSAARAAHTATTLRDGRVLVAGGFLDRGSANGAEVFDPGTGRFLPLPPMITTRHSHTATLLQDGRVLIVGGHGGRRGALTLYASAEIYDPESRSFTLVGGEARLAVQLSAVARLNSGGALITGGYGNAGGPRLSAWTYLP